MSENAEDRELYRSLAISSDLQNEMNQMAKENPHVAHVMHLQWAEFSYYLNILGRGVDDMKKALRRLSRFLVIGSMVVGLIMLGFGIVNIITLKKESHEAHDIQVAIQTSRFDGSYRACLSTDIRNANATATIDAKIPPGSPARAFSLTLINEAVPARGTPGRTPTVATESQKLACISYAADQTDINVPKPPGTPTTPPSRTTPKAGS